MEFRRVPQHIYAQDVCIKDAQGLRTIDGYQIASVGTETVEFFIEKDRAMYKNCPVPAPVALAEVVRYRSAVYAFDAGAPRRYDVPQSLGNQESIPVLDGEVTVTRRNLNDGEIRRLETLILEKK